MAAVLANFVNGQDIRVIQSGRGLGFLLEPSQAIGILRVLWRQEFQRYTAAKPDVLRQVYLAHSASTKLLDDPVMRDDLVDH
jgi:hypothetical protein